MPKPVPPSNSPKNGGIVKPQAPKSDLAKKLFRKILEENDLKAFNGITPAQLLGDEIDIYKWIKDFFKEYKELPSPDVCGTNGHVLPDADSPLEYYVKRVYERSVFNTINSRQKALADAMQAMDVEKAVKIQKDTIAAISALRKPTTYITLKELAVRVKDQYYTAKYTPGLAGIPTGYPSLDAQTGGVLPGELGVVVARPGMGKSYTIIKNTRAARTAGYRVAVVTMEMVNEAFMRRWVGMDARVNPDMIRKGHLSYQGEKTFISTLSSYSSDESDIYFLEGNFHKSTASVDDMLADLDPDAVYIDASYLLAPAEKSGYESGAQLAKTVVNEVKGILLGRKKGGVVSVQFNRNVRKNAKGHGKGGMKFDLADIGGTDAVGQDADWVTGIRLPPIPYRDDHRIYEMMKLREGNPYDFASRFDFESMDFEEVPLASILGTDTSNDEDEHSTAPSGEKSFNKPSWMLK